jgi:chitodextrinase
MRFRGSTRFGRAGSALVAVTLIAGVAAVVGQTLAAAPAGAAPPYNYGEALQKAIWFYDAQRLGDLPANNRVSWRGDAFMNDRDGTLDLTGGFADAGDHIKATFPFAHSMTALAWGMVEYPTAYSGTGQGQYLLSNLRWGMDWLIKAHPSANRLVGEIADPNLDHQVWASAEVQNYNRQVYYIDSTCGGSDLAASAAAAFAASSMVFRASDPTYANTLLGHGRQLYTFADQVRRKYSDCIPVITNFYNSWSGYNDELVWGAIWMSRATTGQESADYLAKAETLYPNLPKEGGSQGTVPEYKWTYDWDDKTIASEILLAKLTGKAQYITDAQRWVDYTTDQVNGYQGEKANWTDGGQVFYNAWGSNRYAVGAAWIAFVAADSGRFDAARNTRLVTFANKQVNYTLGDNPAGVSYMVGFSTNYIKRPHHRTAHGSWKADFYLPVENRHILYGALIGGPKTDDDVYGPEDRNDFTKAEVALDYNAAYVAALGRMWTQFGGTPLANFPPTETPDGPEMEVVASVNAQGTNFIEIKALVNNKSAWPARALANGSFRYYFTLDAGVTPAQIQLQSNYHQCATPTGPTQHSGQVYYITISCAGVDIRPFGDQFFTKENQFRIIFPGAHNPSNDWSFQGVNPTPGGTPTSAPRIPLYDGTTLVWGNPPGGSSSTPPTAPGQPTASNLTSNSVTLTWTASTAGSNPIAGYDVYRVATPADVVVASTNATTLTTPVTGLTPSTAYTFYVRAKDTVGTQSANSPTRGVTTLPPPTPPGPPGQPTASNIGPASVTLTWTAATAGSNPIAGYNVFRVATPADVQVATTTGTGAAALTTPVTGLTPATAYQFYVKARDTTGVMGAASPNRSVTTAAATPPTAPGTPTASNLTSTGVTLTWGASTAGTLPLAGYDVHRVVGGADTVAATTNATTLTAAVSGLTPSTAYTFYVVAKDTGGLSSAASASVPVTTLPGSTSTCRIIYTVNDFNNGGGFGTNFAITNTGTTAINGWTMRFTFPSAQQRITESWSATWTQTGQNVQAVSFSWNANLAPNQTTNIGFNGTYVGTNPRPTAFTLNGVTCSTS